MATNDDGALVSIVVIGYNQSAYIEAALRSVLEQTHKNIELVFVNDGSTDNTLALAQALAVEDCRLTILNQENAGPSAARLYGAQRASSKAEFIAFLDGDDMQHPKFIASAIRYLRRNADATAVMPNFWHMDENGQSIQGRKWNRWVPSRIGLPRLLRRDEPETPFVTFYCASGTVPFFLARHRAYRAVPGWDLRLWPFEDTDMLCQLAMTGKVHALPEKLVGYRVHAGQSTRSGTQQSRHWNRYAADVMRRKWNEGRGLTEDQRATVARACLYYRHVHEPLMTASVAGRALGEFVTCPSWDRLHWFFWVLRQFFRRSKLLFWRSSSNWHPPLPPEAFKGRGEIDAL